MQLSCKRSQVRGSEFTVQPATGLSVVSRVTLLRSALGEWTPEPIAMPQCPGQPGNENRRLQVNVN